MTTEGHAGLEQLTLRQHGADTALAQSGTAHGLYAEIYAEPPYYEHPPT
ncbi:MAG: hypothetical protein ACRDRH_29285 [Pseudonocardia sp.]